MNIAPVLRLRHFQWIFNLVTECSGQWLACSHSRDDLWYCNVLPRVFFFFLLFFGRLPRPHRRHWHWFSWRGDKSWKGRIFLRGKCKCMNTTSLLTTSNQCHLHPFQHNLTHFITTVRSVSWLTTNSNNLGLNKLKKLGHIKKYTYICNSLHLHPALCDSFN